MRTTYALRNDRGLADALAHLAHPGETGLDWPMITSINVVDTLRGQGLGTALLDLICREADAEGTTLGLEPGDLGGPLDWDALVAWYRRHGFEWDRSGWYMVREPR